MFVTGELVLSRIMARAVYGLFPREISVLLTLSNYGSEPVTTCVRRYDSSFFGVVQREGFVGRQLMFQLVEGLLLQGVPYPFGILFKQVSNRFGHFGKVRQELHLLVHHAEKSPYVGDVFRFR